MEAMKKLRHDDKLLKADVSEKVAVAEEDKNPHCFQEDIKVSCMIVFQGTSCYTAWTVDVLCQLMAAWFSRLSGCNVTPEHMKGN